MPNDVIQYTRLVSTAVNVAVAEPMPLIVPEGFALRVRYCEFRLSGLLNVDADLRQAISIVAEQRAFTGDTPFLSYNKFIAYACWSMEVSGTAGLMAIEAVVHRDVWDMNYQLVMRPTLHTLPITNTQAMTAVLAGELVRVSEGQRNAIIATQGGAK